MHGKDGVLCSEAGLSLAAREARACMGIDDDIGGLSVHRYEPDWLRITRSQGPAANAVAGARWSALVQLVDPTTPLQPLPAGSAANAGMTPMATSTQRAPPSSSPRSVSFGVLLGAASLAYAQVCSAALPAPGYLPRITFLHILGCSKDNAQSQGPELESATWAPDHLAPCIGPRGRGRPLAVEGPCLR